MIRSIGIFLVVACCAIRVVGQPTFNLNLNGYRIQSGTWSFRESTSGSVTSYHSETSYNTSQYTQGHLRYNPGPSRDEYRLNYRLLFPVGYNASYDPGYPMIVFLHGAGERGNCWGNSCYFSNDSWSPITNNPQAGPSSNQSLLNNDHNLLHGGQQHLNAVNLAGSKLPNDPTLPANSFPGFVLFPQNLDGWAGALPGNGGNEVENAIRLVYKIIATYNIDPNRIYIHGLSNGAQAVVTAIKKDPSLFAAALLMSPSASNTKVRGDTTISTIPLWIFQGGLDTDPTPNETLTLIRWFEELGGITRYTFYPNLGHGTWNSAYAEPDFFPWMKEKNKANIHVYFGDSTLCATNNIGTKLGVAYGFKAYQWEKDGQIIANAHNASYIVTTPGIYRVRFSRTSATPSESDWNRWSDPVEIKESTPVTPTIIADGTTHLPDINGRDSVVLTTPTLNNVYYDWYKNSVLLPSDTLASYSAKTAGTYTSGTVTFGGCPSYISDPSYVTINAPSTLTAPSNLQTVVTTPGSVQLFWNDNSPNELGFELYRATNTSGPYTYVGTVGEDVISFHDTGIQPSKTYYYKLRAVNAMAVSPYTPNASANTPPENSKPTAPQDLISSDHTINTVNLQWTASTDDTGIQQYYIYYGSDSIATQSTSTSFVVTGLVAGKAYLFTVKARDFDGNMSPPSNQVNVATVVSGLSYEHSTGAWDNLGQINWNVAEYTGHVTNVTLAPRTQEDYFNFKFDGYLYINQAGNYQFRLQSDDGSQLYIGGFSAPYLVVNNDGLHGCNTATSSTYSMTQGPHPITIIFFEKTGGQCLTFSYNGPDTNNKWVTVPDGALKSGDAPSTTPPAAPTNLTATGSGMSNIDLAWTGPAYPNQLKVVVLGSSTAVGTGASTYDSSWVGRLDKWFTANTTSHILTNLAYTGFKTQDVRPDGSTPTPDSQRNITKALSLNPNIILINLPANDIQDDVAITTTMNYYREIKSAADAAGVPVFITTTQPRNFESSPTKRQLLDAEGDSIRNAFGNYVIDIYDWLTDYSNDKRIKSIFDSGDGTHVNNSGHKYIYNQALTKIKSAIQNFEIYRSNQSGGTYTLIDRTDSTGYRNLGLTPTTTYYYKVKTVSPSGVSGFSNVASATTLTDTEAPSVPANLTVMSTTYTNTGLSWSPSTDNVKVTGYEVLLDGQVIDTTSVNAFFTNALMPSTSYTFEVRAFDASGNKSANSGSVNIQTNSPTLFYSASSGSLSSLSTWGDQPGGTGNQPSNFTYNGQYFLITNRTSTNISSTWKVEGLISRVLVDDNVSVNIDSDVEGKINLVGNAAINVNIDYGIEFDNLSATSTVQFNNYSSIPKASYGNLVLTGSGAKLVATGTTRVKGNLTISDGVGLKGTSGNLSSILVDKDLIINGTPSSIPADNLVGLSFSDNAIHTFQVESDQAYFNISTSQNAVVSLNNNASQPITLELGSSNGGGLALDDGSLLSIGNNNLSLKGISTVNSTGSTGSMGVNMGNITLASASPGSSHLHFDNTQKSLNVLTIDLPQGGNAFIESQVQVFDGIKVKSGVLHSQGNLVIKSSATASAAIREIEGGGSVTDNVTVERFMAPKGRLWRYLSSPTANATVADWQTYIPITGTFTGASTGSGLGSNPSMYYYHETPEGWIAYPPASGSNADPILKGVGYSVYIRETTNPTNLISIGPANQGDVTFNLTGGTGSSGDGWNLLGNPYASDIVWNQTDWTSSGVGDIVYVRNNNGVTNTSEYKVWDRTTNQGTLENGKIPAGQAFWVQTDTSTPALTVHESAKTAEPAVNNTEFYRISSSTENYVPYGFSVTLNNGTYQDMTFIKFTSEGTGSFDKLSDGVKQPNSYFNLSTMTNDNVSLVVNNLSNEFCGQTIPLHIDGASAGSYTLTFNNVTQFLIGDIMLNDSYLQTQQPITTDGFEYAFTITTDINTYSNRFTINVSRPELTTSLGLQSNATSYCEDAAQAEVKITNAQEGVVYELYDDNANLISTPAFGNGKDLLITIPMEQLSNGSNSISAVAYFPGCATHDLDNKATVLIDSKPVVSFTSSVVKACIGEKLNIQVNGTGSQFEWTDNLSGLTLSETSASLLIPIDNDYQSYSVRSNPNTACASDPSIIEVFGGSIDPVTITQVDSVLTATPATDSLQWYFNGAEISGETLATLIANESGTFSIVAKNSYCSTESNQITIELSQSGDPGDPNDPGNPEDPNTVTGTNKGPGNEDLTLIVFPNPVQGPDLYVKGQPKGPEDLQIEIIDMLGRPFYRGFVQTARYSEGLIIPVQGALSGVYFVRVAQGTNTVSKKIIIR